METYFMLEDFAKQMLFSSKTEAEISTWQKVLELNKRNRTHIYVN